MPVMALNTVVLPAPFGPMTDTILLAGMFRSTSLTAVRPPKRTVRFEISRMFMMQFSFESLGGQQAFGSEPHHENESKAVEHVFPTAGLDEDISAGDETVRLEKVRQRFQHDRVESRHHERAEQHA